MVSEPRTEALCQGCAGCTRYSDRLSTDHVPSAVGEAYTVRYG